MMQSDPRSSEGGVGSKTQQEEIFNAYTQHNIFLFPVALVGLRFGAGKLDNLNFITRKLMQLMCAVFPAVTHAGCINKYVDNPDSVGTYPGSEYLLR